MDESLKSISRPGRRDTTAERCPFVLRQTLIQVGETNDKQIGAYWMRGSSARAHARWVGNSDWQPRESADVQPSGVAPRRRPARRLLFVRHALGQSQRRHRAEQGAQQGFLHGVDRK